MIEQTTDFALAQNVAKRMAVKFGGDPTVSDRARVFRMPGFRHMKASPFTSRILQIDHFARRYTLAELDERLPPLPRRFVNSNDKGIGFIGVDKAKLLFEHLDVEYLSGNANWQRFAMALNSTCNANEDVAELFFEFCSTGEGYGDEDTDARNRLRWESFDPSHGSGVGIGTLRSMCLEFRVPGLVVFQLFNTAARDFDNV
ncbi:PriCT-2 domain-containing protein [Bradyrhizobium sp. CCBAU 051011]|uniref:PriCT-2 domain-containing protein n=1 Tax=Bradyrhizobium sp. CCBAU 051011 TaxID=858422 RepID=UPI00137AD123|nr:PriCT-2 domain-containing protein [Bradyrhizobium sp. CCBAU 051011]